MGFLSNLGTSFRLTGASVRLVLQYPIVMVLPFFTLLAVTALVVGPVSFLIWLHENHPDAAFSFWKNLYFVTYDAAKAGDWSLAVSSAIIETYILWAIWLTFALTAVLYFATAGMHVATTQIRNGKPSLGEGFRVASRNLHRIFLLALFNASVLAWVQYAVRYTFGLVPILGRWIVRGVKVVLTAVSYLMLPIIIYERAGPINAFRAAWSNVKQTWSGVLIGTGITFAGIFAIFNLMAWSFLVGTLELEPWSGLILTIVSGAVLYTLAIAVSSALRAVLYWYATTGEVPQGFDKSDLPQIQRHGPLTNIGAVSMAATPVATQPATTMQRAPTQVQRLPPTEQPGPLERPRPAAASGGGDPRRLACPKCHTVVVVKFGEAPVCPHCGFGRGPA